MTYTFIQQTEISSAASPSTLTLPSITTTTGNALILVAFSGLTPGLTFTDGSIGNTYTLVGTVTWTGPSRVMQLFYAQNINGGATAIVEHQVVVRYMRSMQQNILV